MYAQFLTAIPFASPTWPPRLDLASISRLPQSFSAQWAVRPAPSSVGPMSRVSAQWAFRRSTSDQAIRGRPTPMMSFARPMMLWPAAMPSFAG